MCLMLYMGSQQALPESAAADVSVERVEEAQQAVKQWFARPVVQYIGSHSGCSCGFPHVVAETVIEYFDGMLLDSEERAADLGSVTALIELVRAALEMGQPVELYPVWI